MRTIWKYKLPRRKDQRITLRMPRNARVLTCGAQGDEDFMWCEVNPKTDCVNHHFLVIGTGEPLPDDISYHHLVTWQRRNHVWHLYEEV